MIKNFLIRFITLAFLILFINNSVFALDRQEHRKKKLEELQEHFKWWLTDTKPAPEKEPGRVIVRNISIS